MPKAREGVCSKSACLWLLLAALAAPSCSSGSAIEDHPIGRCGSRPQTGGDGAAGTGAEAHCTPRDYTGPRLPERFKSTCGVCHSAIGDPSRDFPNLFTFTGTREAFANQVRSGGRSMPPIAASSYSDEDVRATYAISPRACLSNLTPARLTAV